LSLFVKLDQFVCNGRCPAGAFCCFCCLAFSFRLRIQHLSNATSCIRSFGTCAEAKSQDNVTFLRAIPKVTRALALLLLTLTVISAAPGIGKVATKNFALIPQATVGQSKLWNVATGGFIELNPFQSMFNILLILTMGKWIETSWSGRHLFAYVVIVNTLAGICTYAFLLAAYMATQVGSVLYVNPFCVSLAFLHILWTNRTPARLCQPLTYVNACILFEPL